MSRSLLIPRPLLVTGVPSVARQVRPSIGEKSDSPEVRRFDELADGRLAVVVDREVGGAAAHDVLGEHVRVHAAPDDLHARDREADLSGEDLADRRRRRQDREPDELRREGAGARGHLFGREVLGEHVDDSDEIAMLLEGRGDVGEADARHRLQELGEPAELAEIHRRVDQEDAHEHLTGGDR